MILILTNNRIISTLTTKFLKLLGDKLTHKNIQFSSATFQDLEMYFTSASVDIFVNNKSLDTWSTIYPRKVGNHINSAYILATYAQARKIEFIDQFYGKTNSHNSKLVQAFLFGYNKLPIPKTYFSPEYSDEHIENAINFLSLPIIIKQCDESKGQGIKIAHNRSELTTIISELLSNNSTQEIILQEFIENTFEYRILITGNAIAVTETKARTGKDEFRNNVHLGAIEDFFDPKLLRKEICEIALKAAKITNMQFAGVDITEDLDGNPYIFEINSCPGLTLDEKVSNEINQLSNYLISCEKK